MFKGLWIGRKLILAVLVLAIPGAGWVRAAGTDFKQNVSGLPFFTERFFILPLNDVSDPPEDSIFNFLGASTVFVSTLLRRNSEDGSTAQNLFATVDETQVASNYFPAWIFGDSLAMLQVPSDNSAIRFAPLPPAILDFPFGEDFFILPFAPADAPVEFSTEVGGDLENFSFGNTLNLDRLFRAASAFPGIESGPGMMLAGYLDADTEWTLVAFGARTDGGTLAPIPVEALGAVNHENPAIPNVLLADLDGDAVVDRAILVQDSEIPNTPQLFLSRGVGDGSFEAPLVKDLEVQATLLDLAALDLNTDGVNELILSYFTMDGSDLSGGGKVATASDVFGAFTTQDLALSGGLQLPTFLETMDCDLENGANDLLVVTLEAEPEVHASDVLCYLGGDPTRAVVVYPESLLATAVDDDFLPSIVRSSAVGKLGCADAWVGFLAAGLVDGLYPIFAVNAQHEDCSSLSPDGEGNDDAPGPGNSGGPSPELQGGCSLHREFAE